MTSALQSEKSSGKVALVTGGNRGIGLEVCRELARKGYTVLLAARDEAKGTNAAEGLAREKLDVHFLPLDVASDTSVENAAKIVTNQHGTLHALVNCAGVYMDGEGASLARADMDTISKTLDINTLGAVRTIKAFAPLLEKSREGRIVNVSSGMGQLGDMNGGSVGYRLSKTALNAVTRIAHNEFQGKDVKANSACPGWVKTDMGGSNATRTVQEGASGIVWLATLPADGPSGGFFRDGKSINW